ncbi:MAG: agmatinase [Desulfobacterales bacterium]|nr:MAG: agmatinase [Desulfobacterales bacterium]
MTSKSTTDQAFVRDDLHGTVEEPTYSGALSFMRRKYSRDLAGVDVAVTGIPFDLGTSNRPGARLGPRAIRAVSSNLAWAQLDEWGFDALDKLAVIDYGDCDFDPGRPEQIPARIQAHAHTVLSRDVALLSLGGDHFITYPLLQAHAEKYGPLSLIQFDAHSDAWEDEDGRIDHGTMFYHAAQQGLVIPERSVQIGIRTYNAHAWGYNILKGSWVHEHRAQAASAEIRRVVGANKCYLTFDIDCLDPCYAPGTGTPVVGGFTTYQAQQILRGLRGLNLIGMDLVEVAPPYDVGELTALAGASLALEMLYLYAAKPGGA